jgi:hypothetical protein
MEAFRNSGLKVHRRNLEPIVAGMINHVQISDPEGLGDHLVDDVVPYHRLAATWQPRQGTELTAVKRSYGRYLEEPALHYSVGTRVNSAVQKDLSDFGISDIHTHAEAPQFEPKFERVLTSTAHDPDWQTRMGGFYIGRSTSYIPALAQGTSFGDSLKNTGEY